MHIPPLSTIVWDKASGNNRNIKHLMGNYDIIEYSGKISIYSDNKRLIFKDGTISPAIIKNIIEIYYINNKIYEKT